MAYELTVAGYTFENPPESYRKQINLGNADQRAFQRQASSFYQSDSQDLKFEVSGTLALDPAVGGTDDLAELEKLQDLAIEGGEVAVEFDPFFSGNCIIEDDPFEQSEGESSYSFRFTVNTDETDPSAYPAHTTPNTGNTFEFGNLNLGYDPDSVRQNYDRNVETVDRLSGISRSVDTKGLVPEVQIVGNIDGSGQADLWQKARDNVLAYLSAEFQNGWALMDRLEITSNPDAPHYLEGMFRYRLKCYIVMDPGSGIGSVSKAVDRNVQDLDSYVSNCDDDGIFERLGQDDDSYPRALDFRVSGGTGQLRGDYLQWDEEYGTLDQNTTNYLFVEDPDADGYGQVNRNTSGFPATSVALWEVETTDTEIIQIQDQRSCLMGERRETAEGDLNFVEEFGITDRNIDFERFLRLSETLAVDDPVDRFRGIARLTESATVDDQAISFRAKQDFTEPFSVADGGSSLGSGTGGDETSSWGTESDFDAGSDNATTHGNFGVHQDGRLDLGYLPSLANLNAYWPHDETSTGPLTEVVNGLDGTRNGNPQPGQEGPLGTNAWAYDGSGDYFIVGTPPELNQLDHVTVMAWIYWDGGNSGDNWRVLGCDRESSYALLHDSFIDQDDSMAFSISIGGNTYDVDSPNAIPTNQWVHWAGSWDGSTMRIYKNGTEVNSNNPSASGALDDSPDDFEIGKEQDPPSEFFSGKLGDMMVFNTALDASTIQLLGEVGVPAVSPNGWHVSNWKTFSEVGDVGNMTLENVVASLNGQAITIYVESDTDGDGSYNERSDPISLDGSGGPYDVQGLTQDADTFRLRIELDTGSTVASPQFESADLTTSTGGGEDADQNPNTSWEIFGAEYDRSGNEYEGGGVISRYGG